VNGASRRAERHCSDVRDSQPKRHSWGSGICTCCHTDVTTAQHLVTNSICKKPLEVPALSLFFINYHWQHRLFWGDLVAPSLPWFIQTAVTNIIDWCKQQKFISHSDGGQKSKTKVDSASGKGPFLIAGPYCVLTWQRKEANALGTFTGTWMICMVSSAPNHL
jgi:hypothetical protein